jgi:tRNA pseudouridine38-40 synthase
MALRRGFVRYAFSVQYHGSSFLGFVHHKQQEDVILKDGTDFRGYRSVEGRLRQALTEMVGEECFENVKVSSRTDRGVHALKNTCHVDIRMRRDHDENSPTNSWDPQVLRRGLNYYLSRQGGDVLPSRNKKRTSKTEQRLIQRRARRLMDDWPFHYPMNELRIRKFLRAPLTMKNNYHYTHDSQQPAEVEWNVRWSASQRTYIYRILVCNHEDDWALPFEWDRSWRVLPPTRDKNFLDSRHDKCWLNVQDMQDAANYFIGTHDFSSFRGVDCQRASPVVTVREVQVVSQPYGEPLLWGSAGGLLGLGGHNNGTCNPMPRLVTIKIVGTAFVYHQVRNMVGALVAVGRGSLDAGQMSAILKAKDRKTAPAMAPAHGLFLVDVQHDDIDL